MGNNQLSLPPTLSFLANELGLLLSMRDSISFSIMEKISRKLEGFGNEGTKEVVRAILQHEALIDKIAARSYLHQNGFYKIPLVIDKNFSLRLHVWMPGAHSKETLHDHRWFMASTILVGEQKSEIWKHSLEERGDLYDEYLYTDKYTAPVYLGKTKVSLDKTTTRRAGDSYVMNPGTYHRIISHQEDLLVSLMCRTVSVKDWSTNIILNNMLPIVQPNYLTADQLKSVFAYYIEKG